MKDMYCKRTSIFF